MEKGSDPQGGLNTETKVTGSGHGTPSVADYKKLQTLVAIKPAGLPLLLKMLLAQLDTLILLAYGQPDTNHAYWWRIGARNILSLHPILENAVKDSEVGKGFVAELVQAAQAIEPGYVPVPFVPSILPG